MTTNPNACPTCGHSEQHTALIGCLYQDGYVFCDCSSTWSLAQARVPQPKTLQDAHRERDAAMAQVDANADSAWKEAAWTTILALMDAMEAFTADDVWDALAAARVTPPREPRALGPILRNMIQVGLIEAHGYAQSRRRHGSPIRIYSRTYGSNA